MKTYTTTEFVLPGVAINPVNRMKTALMLAFSLSKATNSRNLEHCTYGIWQRTLDDLVADNGQLGIIPQYMLWYLPRNDDEDEGGSDDDEDDEDGEDDEDDDEPEDDESEDDEPKDDDPEDDESEDNRDTKSEDSKVSSEDHQNAGDLSLVSIAATVAQKTAREVLPDFAVIFHRYRTIQN